MAFDEGVKLRVKRRAHFQCCICKAFGVHVHHIEPEGIGGPDTEDNAAPLCPSCHDIYGVNPVKRKAIREARDFWYEICERRYKSEDTNTIELLNERLQNVATKADVSDALQQAMAVVQAYISSSNVSVSQAREAVAYVSASAVSSLTSVPSSSNRVSLGSIFKVNQIAETKADSSSSNAEVNETRKRLI
jgi:hypothetical protein